VIERSATGAIARALGAADTNPSEKETLVMPDPELSLPDIAAAPSTTPADRPRKRIWAHIGRTIAALIADRSLRKAEAELMVLDNRLLKDIGLDRSEIRSALIDCSGERRVGVPSRQWNNGRETDRASSNTTWETVTIRRSWAVSLLVLTSTVIGIVALAAPPSNTRHAEPGVVTGIDPAEIMRKAPRELPVESYLAH
jgi:uncharacterized protein YjiS (DUF1127 family)